MNRSAGRDVSSPSDLLVRFRVHRPSASRSLPSSPVVLLNYLTTSSLSPISLDLLCSLYDSSVKSCPGGGTILKVASSQPASTPANHVPPSLQKNSNQAWSNPPALLLPLLLLLQAMHIICSFLFKDAHIICILHVFFFPLFFLGSGRHGDAVTPYVLTARPRDPQHNTREI